MAAMFSGLFVVFLSALFGPRRILIPASLVFALSSAFLPLRTHLAGCLRLMVVAGLSSGTFYSLTMTFVLNALPRKLIIFGVAAYAADIVFTANVAPALESLVHRTPVVALDLLELRCSGASAWLFAYTLEFPGGLYLRSVRAGADLRTSAWD